MALGFNFWVEAGLAAASILEEHDFRPYSPDGEKELMISRAQVYSSSRSRGGLMSGLRIENRAGLFGSLLTLAQD